jgi:hypothetical protein
MSRWEYIEQLDEQLNEHISNCKAIQLNQVEEATGPDIYRISVDSFETEPEDENRKFKWIVEMIDKHQRRLNQRKINEGRKIVTNRIYFGLNRILYAEYVVLDSPGGGVKGL